METSKPHGYPVFPSIFFTDVQHLTPQQLKYCPRPECCLISSKLAQVSGKKSLQILTFEKAENAIQLLKAGLLQIEANHSVPPIWTIHSIVSPPV